MGIDIESVKTTYIEDLSNQRFLVNSLLLSMNMRERLLYPYKIIKYQRELLRLDKLDSKFTSLVSQPELNNDKGKHLIVDFIEKNPVDVKCKTLKYPKSSKRS